MAKKPPDKNKSQKWIKEKLRETVPGLSSAALAAFARLQANAGSADDEELVNSEIARMAADIRKVFPENSGPARMERDSQIKVLPAPYEILRSMGEL